MITSETGGGASTLDRDAGANDVDAASFAQIRLGMGKGLENQSGTGGSADAGGASGRQTNGPEESKRAAVTPWLWLSKNRNWLMPLTATAVAAVIVSAVRRKRLTDEGSPEC